MEKSKKKRELLLFVIIAIGWSWIFWLAEMLLNIKLYVAPFGPLIAAFYLTYIKENKKGLIKLIKRGLDYKFKKVWYLPIIFLMPIIAGLTIFITSRLGAGSANVDILTKPLPIIGNFVYILFLGGPLQEEFGWRGYALPRLLKRYNALVASIILGLIWSIWHLPLNFISQAGLQYQAAVSYVISSMILMVFVSILFTWIYTNTGGSILAVLIFHTMLNLSTYVIFPVFELEMGPPIYMFLILIVTLIVIFTFGYKNLTYKKI
ncbi:MAG TPA: type II CAAX endopeptidase family protein [Halanaerobiales bacterium]|nr:type II CAAX endopeptidase family protein [Halanaerobiales bacterium]